MLEKRRGGRPLPGVSGYRTQKLNAGREANGTAPGIAAIAFVRTSFGVAVAFRFIYLYSIAVSVSTVKYFTARVRLSVLLTFDRSARPVTHSTMHVFVYFVFVYLFTITCNLVVSRVFAAIKYMYGLRTKYQNTKTRKVKRKNGIR